MRIRTLLLSLFVLILLGAVLLLHGIHSDRRAMVGHARFLHAQGDGVLPADLPGQGESLARW